MLQTKSQWFIAGIIFDACVFLDGVGGDQRHALLRVGGGLVGAAANGNCARQRQSYNRPAAVSNAAPLIPHRAPVARGSVSVA